MFDTNHNTSLAAANLMFEQLCAPSSLARACASDRPSAERPLGGMGASGSPSPCRLPLSGMHTGRCVVVEALVRRTQAATGS
jgi:hypothetical protein